MCTILGYGLPERETYGMLPICKAFVCLPFYKRSFHIPLQSSWGGARPLSVSSSSILSFIQTYSILLSTIRQADGFETTDCLECLQILDILIYGSRVCFKAGDWILCTMIGYRIPERETFCMLSFSATFPFL